MAKLQYERLIANTEAQIGASGPRERAPLRAHLSQMRHKAARDGVHFDRHAKRAELDRIEEEVEAQFDNLPI